MAVPNIVEIIVRTVDESSAKFAAISAEVGGLESNLARFTGTATAFATAAGVVAVGLTAIGAESIKAASGYQALMNYVQNNTTMTSDQVKRMHDEVLQLSKDTGSSTDELAKGYMHIVNETGNVSDAMSILSAANESAVATGGNVTATANILANTMHEYGLDISHATDAMQRHNEVANNAVQVMGEMHLAAANANMTLEEFANNFGQISAWGANLGIPKEQLMAAFATMTKHGFDPATAATQVKDIMPHIIKPSKGALAEASSLDEQLAKAGFDDSTVEGEQQTDRAGNPIGRVEGLLSATTLNNIGIQGVMEQLKKTFDELGLSEAQQTSELMRLVPNMRGGAAMFTLLGQGAKDYKDILAQLLDPSKVMTVTQESFNRTQETAAYQWRKLKTDVHDFGIELGEFLLPKVAPLINMVTQQLPGGLDAMMEGITGKKKPKTAPGGPGHADAMQDQDAPLTPLQNGMKAIGEAVRDGFDAFMRFVTFIRSDVIPVIQRVAEVIREHPDLFKQIAAGIAIAVAAFTVLGTTISVVTGVIAVLTSPVTLVIAAVAGLVIGVKLLIDHWDQITAKVPALGTAFDAVQAFITGTFLPNMQRLGDWFVKTAIPALQQFGEWLGPKLVAATQATAGFITGTIIPAIQHFSEWLGPKVVTVVQATVAFITGQVIPAIQQIGSWLIGTGIPAVTRFAQLMSGELQAAFTTVSSYITGQVIPAIQDLVTWFQDHVVPAVQAFVDFVRDVLWPVIQTYLTTIFDFWQDHWTQIHDTFFATVNLIKDVATTTFEFIKNAVITSVKELNIGFQAAWQLIRGTFQNELDAITGVFHLFKDLFTGNWRALWGDVKQILSALWAEIQLVFNVAVDLVKSTLSNAWTFIKTEAQTAWDGFKRIISDVWEGVKNIFILGKDAFTEAILWPFKEAARLIGGIAESIKTAIATPWNSMAGGLNNFFTGFDDAINSVADKLHIGDKIHLTPNHIPTFARGGTMTGSGLALVGEEGPELIKLPTGSTVLSNPQTTALGRGLGPSDVLNGVGDFVGAIGESVQGLLNKGADLVLNEAFKLLPGFDNLSGLTKDLAGGMASTLKTAVIDAFKTIFSDLKSHVHTEGSAVGGGDVGGAGYAGGSSIIDMAMRTPGAYMWCEKFVGDVMQRLGLQYYRAGSAEAHSYMQPLNPGYGPQGSIQFFRDGGYGHVAFNVDGSGLVFGTLNTASGTGFHNFGSWGNSGGWTLNPRWEGGPINEPVIGRGMHTGQSYSFAEYGPEYVVNPAKGQVGGVHLHGDIYVNVDTHPGMSAEAVAQKTVERIYQTVQRSGVAG